MGLGLKRNLGARSRPVLDTRRETQALCEEQRKQIAELIVEAIRRHAEKIANQKSAADAEKNDKTEAANES